MDEELYDQALHNMETALHSLAQRVPQPKRVPARGSFVYRYVEKTAHQALVQKLARFVTGLQGARILLEHGFVQEQATLQRVLDEIEEDITFLSFAIIRSDVTPLHQAYLNAFYQEEFDLNSISKSSQKRSTVARKKVRAYISRCFEGAGVSRSHATQIGRTLSKVYSGYVHAASPQIMDMYGGDPPHYHIRGMRDTPRQADHRRDLWNYFYRGILAFAIAAKAFGDEVLFAKHGEFARKFSLHAGEDYWPE